MDYKNEMYNFTKDSSDFSKSRGFNAERQSCKDATDRPTEGRPGKFKIS